VKSVAAVLLLLGVLRHYLWHQLPNEIQALAWNISGAVVITIFLWAIAYQWYETQLIALWWTFEEFQVIACSLARILRPKPVGAGEAQCTALLGFDLSSIGLLAISAILFVKLYSGHKKESTP